jgi:hypothetical protein
MTKLTDDLWRYVQVRPKENYACSEMPSKRDDQLGARIDTLRSILAGGPRGLGGPPDLKWAWENRRRCAICVSGMQRLEYRTHIATSILVGAFGVVALVGSVTSVVLGTMSKSGATGVIIGFIGLPLALYFVAGALRPAAVTADDTGLRLRRVFGTQRIPWAAMRGFRMVTSGRAGPSVQAILRTGEVITLPQTTSSGAKSKQIVAELTAALSEHDEPLQPPR